MEQNVGRGRGRGRATTMKPNEVFGPGILRRPHAPLHLEGQASHPQSYGAANQSILTENRDQILVGSNPHHIQDLHITAANPLSATGITLPDGNSNKSQNIPLVHGVATQLKQDMTSFNNSIVPPIMNTQRQIPQGVTSNHPAPMQIIAADQVLTSFPNNSPNIIQAHSPSTFIQNKSVQNHSANIVQPFFVTQHALNYPKGAYPDGPALVQQENIFFQNQLHQKLSTMSLNNASGFVPKASTLSADAPVFVPRSAPASAVPPNPTLNYFNSASPNSGLSSDQNVDAAGASLPPHAIPQAEFFNHPVILQVNNLVVNLTLKPHKFDQIAAQLTSILSWQVKDVNLMKEIITVIFEQGVGESNFRYNGARLCQYVNKHISPVYNVNGPSFRDLLFKRCQDEYTCKDLYLVNNVERLCGFALFLADIFSHLVSSSSCYFEKLQTGVCGVLKTLMKKPSNETLKCVAKVLKGTGYALESCGSEEMDKVMMQLKDVAMTAPVGVDVRALLLSIIELRASNWGKGHRDAQSTLSDEHANGTVYYGPNGDILKVVSEDSGSDTDDSFCGNPEEDDEIFKAYEEFLKSQVTSNIQKFN